MKTDTEALLRRALDPGAPDPALLGRVKASMRKEQDMRTNKYTKRIVTLALAAALVLALGVTAYAALDGAEWFKSWFASTSGTELTEGQKEYIDRAAADVGQSVTAGGWTVTLQSAMTDGERVFMSLTARPEEERTELHNTCLYGLLTSTDPDAPEDYFYGPTVSTFDQEYGAASQMEEKTVDPKYRGREIDFSYPLTLTLDHLRNGPDGEETVAEGPWVFKFTLTPGGNGELEVVDEPFTAIARFEHEYLNGEPFDPSTLEPGTMVDSGDGLEIRYEAVDVTVTSLKLNPMGAVCTYVYEGELSEDRDPERGPDIGDVKVELAGGSGQVGIMYAGGGWEESQQAYVTRYEFAAPIDLDEVTAVTFQGHALTLPNT